MDECKCGLKLRYTWKVCPECLTEVKTKDYIIQELRKEVNKIKKELLDRKKESNLISHSILELDQKLELSKQEKNKTIILKEKKDITTKAKRAKEYADEKNIKFVKAYTKLFGVRPSKSGYNQLRKLTTKNEYLTYVRVPRKRSKNSVKNSVNKAMELSKQEKISFGKAYKVIFGKYPPKLDYEYYSEIKEDNTNWKEKRMRWVASRGNYLMRTYNYSREKAFSMACNEWNRKGKIQKVVCNEEKKVSIPGVSDELIQVIQDCLIRNRKVGYIDVSSLVGSVTEWIYTLCPLLLRQQKVILTGELSNKKIKSGELGELNLYG